MKGEDTMILANSEIIRLYENEMLAEVSIKMKSAYSSDSILKYYRHAKIWLTNHRFVAKACTKARYEELNTMLIKKKEEALYMLDMKKYEEEIKNVSETN